MSILSRIDVGMVGSALIWVIVIGAFFAIVIFLLDKFGDDELTKSAAAAEPAEFEPCPFCSSEKLTIRCELTPPGATVARDWRCVCNTCRARGPVSHNKAVAIHLWNKRATPKPTTPEQIEKQFKNLKAAAAMAGLKLDTGGAKRG